MREFRRKSDAVIYMQALCCVVKDRTSDDDNDHDDDNDNDNNNNNMGV